MSQKFAKRKGINNNPHRKLYHILQLKVIEVPGNSNEKKNEADSEWSLKRLNEGEVDNWADQNDSIDCSVKHGNSEAAVSGPRYRKTALEETDQQLSLTEPSTQRCFYTTNKTTTI